MKGNGANDCRLRCFRLVKRVAVLMPQVTSLWQNVRRCCCFLLGGAVSHTERKKTIYAFVCVNTCVFSSSQVDRSPLSMINARFYKALGIVLRPRLYKRIQVQLEYDAEFSESKRPSLPLCVKLPLDERKYPCFCRKVQ